MCTKQKTSHFVRLFTAPNALLKALSCIILCEKLNIDGWQFAALCREILANAHCQIININKIWCLITALYSVHCSQCVASNLYIYSVAWSALLNRINKNLLLVAEQYTNPSAMMLEQCNHQASAHTNCILVKQQNIFMSMGMYRQGFGSELNKEVVQHYGQNRSYCLLEKHS